MVPAVVRYDRWLALEHSADVALLRVVGLADGLDDHVDQVRPRFGGVLIEADLQDAVEGLNGRLQVLFLRVIFEERFF